MTAAFDPRILRVTLELQEGNVTYEDLAISVTGRKFASASANQCECVITNLTAEHRNYVLTQASPLKQPRTPIKMIVEAGRKSYGAFRLFEGAVIACNTTQPPDIGVLLSSLTNNFQTGLIAGASMPPVTSTRTIAQDVANRMGLRLQFEATEKNIDNYTHSGAISAEIRKLESFGDVNAYVDNDALVVIDANKTRKGDVRLINAATGMIGIPQVTDSGVLVRMLLDNSIQLGGKVKIESEVNPAANGEYKVLQIAFAASNRAQPFEYNLVCSNLAYVQGTA